MLAFLRRPVRIGRTGPGAYLPAGATGPVVEVASFLSTGRSASPVADPVLEATG